MRCSKCNEVIRPVVACDIDGVLGDYHGPFIEFIARYLGVVWWDHLADSEPYEGAGSLRMWAMESFGIDERTWLDIKLAYRQGGNKRFQPIYNGAREFLSDVVKMKAELWLTTTRPHNRLDNIDPDTRFWLENQLRFSSYQGLLFDEDKYAKLAEIVDPVRVVAVADDLEENLVRADDFFPGTTILVRNGYNDGVQTTRPTARTAALSSLIRPRVNAWWRQHGQS